MNFELSKKLKENEKKKGLCIWNVRDLQRRTEKKKMGLAKLWI